MESGNAESIQRLGPGDLVFVPERDQVLMTGAVARPGSVSVAARPSLSQVIANVGGTLEGARRNSILLRRLLPQGTSYQQFTVDLIAIEQRRIGDIILQPGDIIEIPTNAANFGNRLSLVAVLRQLALDDHQSTVTKQLPLTNITSGPPATKNKEKP
ncbi:MAG: SLBB domain-containing protein [Pyrinomonadaceae bacterium]